MKRTVSILFLFVILFQSTSKLWIMGAFYLNRDYISKNICINRFDAVPICKGQCYLKKELKENEKQEQKFPDLKQKEIQLFCHQNLRFNVKYTLIQNKERSVNNNANFYSNNYHTSVFHPPQAV